MMNPTVLRRTTDGALVRRNDDGTYSFENGKLSSHKLSLSTLMAMGTFKAAEPDAFERKNQFLSRVEELRKEKGWKKQDLARAMGMASSELSRIYSQPNLTMRTIVLFENALGAKLFNF